jgi:hypothetical protein
LECFGYFELGVWYDYCWEKDENHRKQ